MQATALPQPAARGGSPLRTGVLARLEWIVARAFFPLALGGAVAWSIFEIEAGRDLGVAVGVPTILAYFVIAAVERIFYWQPDWLHSNGDLKVDFLHLLVSGLLTTRLLEVPSGSARSPWAPGSRA